MATIIYYDANRTVRQLISQALRARSYTVVEIESLDDYRSAIDDNADVEAIILDMSRHPDRLPVLQNELPSLFHRPDRCIITIGRSNDLTPYLPESAEACFFKHVVERPFKKNEFVDFIASLIGNRTAASEDGATNVKKCHIETIDPNATCELSADTLARSNAQNDIIPSDLAMPSLIQPQSSDRDISSDVTHLKKIDIDKPNIDETLPAPSSTDLEVNDATTSEPPTLVTAPSHPTLPKQKQFHVLPSDPANRKENRMSRIGRSPSAQPHARIHARDAYRAMRPDIEYPSPHGSEHHEAELDERETKETCNVENAAKLPPSQNDGDRQNDGILQNDGDRQNDDNAAELPPFQNDGDRQSDEPIVETSALREVDENLKKGISIQAQILTHIDARKAPKLPRPICPLPPPFRLGRSADPLAATLAASVPNDDEASDSATRHDETEKVVPRKPAFLASQAPAEPPLPMFRSGIPQFAPTIEPTSSNNLTLPSSCADIPVDIRTSFQTLWFVRLLCESILSKSRFTLVANGGQTRHVLFVEAGRAFWFESFIAGHIPSINEYLSSITDTTIPVESIKNHVRANRCALSQAFKSLKLEDVAAQLCRSRIRSGIDGIFTQWSALTFEVYEGIPEPYAAVIRLRPCKFISLPPIIFEKLRDNEDVIIAPRAFSDLRFVMRAFRSPLNARIQLTPEELDFLATIQSPKTLQQIKQLGKKHARDTLYRLWLFQFIDLCA